MRRTKTKRRKRKGLLRLFVMVLFVSGVMISGVSALALYILAHIGALEVTPAVVHGMGRIMSFFMVLSILVSMLVAAVNGKFALKPVHDLIDGMNALASGDYKTRVNVSRIMRRHPPCVELAESFNLMAEELDSTEMLRSDFINNFSHEFKTPIVSIAGFAQLLRHGNLPKEQQDEYLAIIEEESMRLSSMATNVLNLTRVENQSILTDVTEYNLSEQLRACILLLENKWSKKDIDLQLDFGEHNICANEELLKQVWINLLDNAVKFTPDGHIIQVTIQPREGELAVTIRNTGSEIPPDSRELIFNKFYQADKSHATQGNGVGLAIVKRVVALHGGTVTVESENMETAFTVTLPQ